MNKRKIITVIFFLVVLLVWIGTISHDTLGFVPLNGGESVGFDFFTAFVWLLFAYSVRKLYLAFRKKPSPIA